MLALVGANAVGVLLFAMLYVVAGTRELSPWAFLVCLATLFTLVTALWIRTEARHQRLDLVRRLGRAAAGLVVVLVATPPLVLMPAFWLESVLPPENEVKPWLGPIMALVLIALVLVVLTNVIGSIVVAARALAARRASSR
jgi:hypothetical protein